MNLKNEADTAEGQAKKTKRNWILITFLELQDQATHDTKQSQGFSAPQINKIFFPV